MCNLQKQKGNQLVQLKGFRALKPSKGGVWFCFFFPSTAGQMQVIDRSEKQYQLSLMELRLLIFPCTSSIWPECCRQFMCLSALIFQLCQVGSGQTYHSAAGVKPAQLNLCVQKKQSRNLFCAHCMQHISIQPSLVGLSRHPISIVISTFVLFKPTK